MPYGISPLTLCILAYRPKAWFDHPGGMDGVTPAWLPSFPHNVFMVVGIPHPLIKPAGINSRHVSLECPLIQASGYHEHGLINLVNQLKTILKISQSLEI